MEIHGKREKAYELILSLTQYIMPPRIIICTSSKTKNYINLCGLLDDIIIYF